MPDTESLLPVYCKTENGIGKMQKSHPLFTFKISFRRFAVANILFSYGSFAFCVCWSIIFNFEEATATHCSVPNLLPSISAAIGHFYPQIYVWNTMIIIQTLARLKVTSMYYYYHATIIYELYSGMIHTVWLLSIVELTSLCLLSFITSTTFYKIHAAGFVTFLFSSMLNMVLTCHMLGYNRKIPPTTTELRTWWWKFKCCFMNIFCFLMAGYFFRRHNLYCEPGVYSLFALFEYFVVMSNMMFHSLALKDFEDKTLTVMLSCRGGLRVDCDPPFKPVQYK